MPLVFVTYSFAYLDRSNYSLGATGGLKDALHITSGQAGLLGGLFFAGYFLFQVPAADFAERRNVKRLKRGRADTVLILGNPVTGRSPVRRSCSWPGHF
jgi:sugar phosphate permease